MTYIDLTQVKHFEGYWNRDFSVHFEMDINDNNTASINFPFTKEQFAITKFQKHKIVLEQQATQRKIIICSSGTHNCAATGQVLEKNIWHGKGFIVKSVKPVVMCNDSIPFSDL